MRRGIARGSSDAVARASNAPESAWVSVSTQKDNCAVIISADYPAVGTRRRQRDFVSLRDTIANGPASGSNKIVQRLHYHMKLTYPGVQLSTSCVRTEIRLGWALLVVTAAVTGLLGWELTDTAARFLRNEDWAAAAGHLVFMGIVAALLYGSVVYQLTRIGGFQRRATFAPATDPELSRTYHEAAAGKLVVLVPSYKEEAKVVRRTLMSAALQDYPRRRVVLLIDDPPAPQDSAKAATLQAMRALPESLRQLFDAAAQPFVAALGQFKARAESNLDVASEAHRLASLHRLAARWCLLQKAGFASGDSGDVVFRELVLRKAAQAHLAAAASIKWAARRGRLDRTRLQLEYHRLARRFRVRLRSFERKRYANLSHEPNKAMNLNSYLGLMGA